MKAIQNWDDINLKELQIKFNSFTTNIDSQCIFFKGDNIPKVNLDFSKCLNDEEFNSCDFYDFCDCNIENNEDLQQFVNKCFTKPWSEIKNDPNYVLRITEGGNNRDREYNPTLDGRLYYITKKIKAEHFYFIGGAYTYDGKHSVITEGVKTFILNNNDLIQRSDIGYGSIEWLDYADAFYSYEMVNVCNRKTNEIEYYALGFRRCGLDNVCRLLRFYYGVY